MNLTQAFKQIKERDDLTFNLSAVKILLVISERQSHFGCTATMIAEAMGNTNSRTQLRKNIDSLLKHELVFVEQFGKTKKYRPTISGFNLLTEIDKAVGKTKLKKQSKRKPTRPVSKKPVPLKN
ncbi:hypothetical protein IQ13_2197 [Lacibacter cauensis]|uniref:Transcriptional regulator n=1 Tax=Lacibacter cauensis TaxID=510947 RepID=A0A562SIT2_9BACT|nr:hypothetical protein IQ13_2197 [Lacibacter cauensis]